jgi:hypothetical protein
MFNSYRQSGFSDVESEKVTSEPFVEHHDIRTPSITPTYSPVQSIGTPSLSQEEILQPAPVVIEQVVMPPPPAVTAVKDASVECQL